MKNVKEHTTIILSTDEIEALGLSAITSCQSQKRTGQYTAPEFLTTIDDIRTVLLEAKERNLQK